MTSPCAITLISREVESQIIVLLYPQINFFTRTHPNTTTWILVLARLNKSISVIAASNKCFIIHTLWSRDVDVAMSHVPLHPAYQTTPLYSAQWRQYIVYDIWRQMRHWDIAMTSSDVFDVKWYKCSNVHNATIFCSFYCFSIWEQWNVFQSG